MTTTRLALLLATVMACRESEQAGSGAASMSTVSGPPDACSLLTQGEAEEVLGPLVQAPQADSTGKGCAYRTAGDRLLVVTPEWTYGKSELDASRMIGGLVARVADVHGAVADTLEGPWDDVAFGPNDVVFLVKARALTFAYANSSTDVAGVVKLARPALARLAAVPEPERAKDASGGCPLPSSTVSEVFGQEVRVLATTIKRMDACSYQLVLDPTVEVELAVHPGAIADMVFDGLSGRAKAHGLAEPNKVGEEGMSWGSSAGAEAAVRAKGQVYQAKVFFGLAGTAENKEEAMVKLVELMIH